MEAGTKTCCCCRTRDDKRYILRYAEERVESCEHCHPDDAEIPFDWALAEVTGKRVKFDFVLTQTARCPNCRKPITEKTLVELRERGLSTRRCFVVNLMIKRTEQSLNDFEQLSTKNG